MPYLSIQQRARLYPCRREHGGCGASPGELCVTWQGRKSYTAHLDRLEQENEAALNALRIRAKEA